MVAGMIFFFFFFFFLNVFEKNIKFKFNILSVQAGTQKLNKKKKKMQPPATLQRKLDIILDELGAVCVDRISVSEFDGLLRKVGVNMKSNLIAQVYSKIGGQCGVFSIHALHDMAEMFPALIESLYTRCMDLQEDASQQLEITNKFTDVNNLKADREALNTLVSRLEGEKESLGEAIESASEKVEAAVEREKEMQEQMSELFEESSETGAQVRKLQEQLGAVRNQELIKVHKLNDINQQVSRANERFRAAERDYESAKVTVSSIERKLAKAQEEAERKKQHVESITEEIDLLNENIAKVGEELAGITEPLQDQSEELVETQGQNQSLKANYQRAQTDLTARVEETERLRRSRDSERERLAKVESEIQMKTTDAYLIADKIKNYENEIDMLNLRSTEWRNKRKAIADEDLQFLEQELRLRIDRNEVEDGEKSLRESFTNYTSGTRRVVLSDLSVNRSRSGSAASQKILPTANLSTRHRSEGRVHSSKLSPPRVGRSPPRVERSPPRVGRSPPRVGRPPPQINPPSRSGTANPSDSNIGLSRSASFSHQSVLRLSPPPAPAAVAPIPSHISPLPSPAIHPSAVPMPLGCVSPRAPDFSDGMKYSERLLFEGKSRLISEAIKQDAINDAYVAAHQAVSYTAPPLPTRYVGERFVDHSTATEIRYRDIDIQKENNRATTPTTRVGRKSPSVAERVRDIVDYPIPRHLAEPDIPVSYKGSGYRARIQERHRIADERRAAGKKAPSVQRHKKRPQARLSEAPCYLQPVSTISVNL